MRLSRLVYKSAWIIGLASFPADSSTNVAGVSPVVSSSVSVKFEKTSTDVTVEGITPEYELVNDFSVQTGRYIATVDEINAQKVALIGVTSVFSKASACVPSIFK